MTATNKSMYGKHCVAIVNENIMSDLLAYANSSTH